MNIDAALSSQFSEKGFAGPIPILNREECRRALYLRNSGSGVYKGNAMVNYGFYEIACRADIIDLVRELIGEDIFLWGARIIHRNAGSAHPWHTDIECSGDSGKAVNVWIGLERTNEQTGLQLLSHSHTFGCTLQEVAHGAGKKRCEVTSEDILQWGKQRNSQSQLVRMEMHDGEALVMDGNLWHFSQNTMQEGTRVALLLQYASPDKTIRLPRQHSYEWPFQFSDERTPCILINGSDRFGFNQIASPAQPNPLWPNWIQKIESLSWVNKKPGWKSASISRSGIGALSKFNCHVSTLEEEKTPHPPHQHPEEELFLVLSGQVEIIRVNENQETTQERIGPGSFVYHAAYQRHTIRNAGPGRAMYLMFKWEGSPRPDQQERLQSSTFHVWEGRKWNRQGFRQIRMFHQPTLYLEKLHAHFSVLHPGTGYPAHRDPYHVAIVVLKGTVNTLDQEAGPGSVIFYHANEPHGMENHGASKASYLVFEFHE
ncbi:cupin domain-containing protein [bacterium]|nr:cupin domain-containing protein [bacterium]